MSKKAALNTLAGTNNKNDVYDQAYVKSGLIPDGETLPTGERGANVSKIMKRVGQREMGKSRMQQVEDGGKDGYGVVAMNDWTEGWASYVEREYGHRNAFLALSAFNGTAKDLIREFGEDKLEDAESVLAKVATRIDPNNKDAEEAATKGVTKSPVQADIGTDPQGIVNATPIMVDPDLVNTVRSAAPVLNWVDVVAQAGFYASYNVVSSREEPSHGWSTEEEVRNLVSDTGSAFTIGNEEKEMDIWLDLLDISDFASRALSSLDFMDLEGTSVEVRSQEYATEEAEMVFYGNPDGALTDGSAHDAEAPAGLYKTADDANTSYTIDRSGYSLSGDKPLFEDIKSYVHGLVKNTGAQLQNLGIVTSIDMFNALENEANVNVRLDSFDGTINFGRSPTVNTLSIANVPVLPDPNVRDHSYGSGEYDGNIGDVFIFERPNAQRRALQPFSSTALGQIGLADRMALFQYETFIDKSQGEHVRVLEDYQIPAVSDT